MSDKISNKTSKNRGGKACLCTGWWDEQLERLKM